MTKMPEEIINGVKIKAVRIEDVFEVEHGAVPKVRRPKKGFVVCPVWTSFDNGTWDDFLRVQLEAQKRCKEFLTREELEALAEYCWKHCRHWTGMDYMNEWVFLINNRKVVGFSFRGWGGFMSRVEHKMTGKVADKMDYIKWYA
ncbi:hypothetical protein [Archaeoglobus sp.]